VMDSPSGGTLMASMPEYNRPSSTPAPDEDSR